MSVTFMQQQPYQCQQMTHLLAQWSYYIQSITFSSLYQ